MASRSLNKVQLIGNLTRDPELRYTPQGTAVCTIGMATNRTWKTESGDQREDTQFHRIVAWNKLAEICSKLLFKGRRVFIEGRLNTRQWTAQDGTSRQTTEIVIDDMLILDSKRAPGEEGEEFVSQEQTITKGAPVVIKETESAKPEKEEKKKEKLSSPAKPAEKTVEKKPQKQEETEVKAEDIPF